VLYLIVLSDNAI